MEEGSREIVWARQRKGMQQSVASICAHGIKRGKEIVIVEDKEPFTHFLINWASNNDKCWIENDPELIQRYTANLRRRSSNAIPTSKVSFTPLNDTKREKRKSYDNDAEENDKKVSINNSSNKRVIEDDDSSETESDRDSKFDHKADEENDADSVSIVEVGSDDGESITDTDSTECLFSDDSADLHNGYTKKKHAISSSEAEGFQNIGLLSLSRYRDALEPFVPRKVEEMLEKLLKENIELNMRDHKERATDVLITQPSMLSTDCVMKNYQLEGLSWLVSQYHLGISSILADEMGLGKTLQSIAFIAQIRYVMKHLGRHLVVCPLSVLSNWISEFKKWCPILRVQRLHSNDYGELNRMKVAIGNSRETDVVVTTYEMLKSAGIAHFLKRIIWRTVILDEGHRIKNDESGNSHACCALKACFRLILTGTPVQNNLHESFSLLKFLSPKIFTDSSAFDEAFDLGGKFKKRRSSNSESVHSSSSGAKIDRDLLAKAHYMLRAFVLRRLKAEVEQKLPPKLETKIDCPMTEMQEFFVKQLLLKEKDLFSRLSDTSHSAIERSHSGADLKKLFGLVAQLRKASNHPYLFPGAEKVTPNGQPTEEIITASGKMIILHQLLQKLYERGHRVVLFSQFKKTLDIISDYLVMVGYKSYRLDGDTNRVMRGVYVNLFNQPNCDVFIFLLSTRAGGEGVNLFTADTVILFDSDWNPQVDIQAMARVHRIGQTKPVHVYRLVTSGSIEERIVQRAQKKLFLDTMVNRGSTATALSLDEVEPSDESNEHDGESASKMLSVLKFGWNSVFSVTKSHKNGLSDEELDKILDRSRGLSGPVENEVTDGTILENQEQTVDNFDESVPFIEIRNVEVFGDVKDIAKAWRGENSSSSEATEEAKHENLPHVEDEMEQTDKNSDSLRRSRRESKARTKNIFVEGVGHINVALEKKSSVNKLNNEVSTHPSIFVPKSGRQIAGRDFKHLDVCQVCWNGGTLYICDFCPGAYHMKCLSPIDRPKPDKKQWTCPHHICCECRRGASAVSLLFRCEICEKAFCEDCLPSEANILGRSSRFEALGYSLTSSSCYIQCSLECMGYADNEHGVIDGDTEEREVTDKNSPQRSLNQSDFDSSSNSNQNANDVEQNVETTLSDEEEVSNITERIDLCITEDITDRLNRYKFTDGLKFKNLWEIPNISFRLQSFPNCSAILSTIINELVSLGGMLCDGSKVDDLKTSDREDVSATREDRSEEKEKEKETDNDEKMFGFLEYCGFPCDIEYERLVNIFLHCVKFFTQVSKRELCHLCEILGICQMTNVTKNAKIDANNPFLTLEPKFCFHLDGKKKALLEECIAAFLVVPCPQNFVLPVSGKFSAGFVPSSMLTSFRLLDALGQPVFDENKYFFVSFSFFKDYHLDIFRQWVPRLIETEATSEQRKIWLDPIIRWFFSSSKEEQELPTKVKEYLVCRGNIIDSGKRGKSSKRERENVDNLSEPEEQGETVPSTKRKKKIYHDEDYVASNSGSSSDDSKSNSQKSSTTNSIIDENYRRSIVTYLKMYLINHANKTSEDSIRIAQSIEASLFEKITNSQYLYFNSEWMKSAIRKELEKLGIVQSGAILPDFAQYPSKPSAFVGGENGSVFRSAWKQILRNSVRVDIIVEIKKISSRIFNDLLYILEPPSFTSFCEHCERDFLVEASNLVEYMDKSKIESKIRSSNRFKELYEKLYATKCQLLSSASASVEHCYHNRLKERGEEFADNFIAPKILQVSEAICSLPIFELMNPPLRDFKISQLVNKSIESIERDSHWKAVISRDVRLAFAEKLSHATTSLLHSKHVILDKQDFSNLISRMECTFLSQAKSLFDYQDLSTIDKRIGIFLNKDLELKSPKPGQKNPFQQYMEAISPSPSASQSASPSLSSSSSSSPAPLKESVVSGQSIPAEIITLEDSDNEMDVNKSNQDKTPQCSTSVDENISSIDNSSLTIAGQLNSTSSNHISSSVCAMGPSKSSSNDNSSPVTTQLAASHSQALNSLPSTGQSTSNSSPDDGSLQASISSSHVISPSATVQPGATSSSSSSSPPSLSSSSFSASLSSTAPLSTKSGSKQTNGKREDSSKEDNRNDKTSKFEVRSDGVIVASVPQWKNDLSTTQRTAIINQIQRYLQKIMRDRDITFEKSWFISTVQQIEKEILLKADTIAIYQNEEIMKKLIKTKLDNNELFNFSGSEDNSLATVPAFDSSKDYAVEKLDGVSSRVVMIFASITAACEASNIEAKILWKCCETGEKDPNGSCWRYYRGPPIYGIKMNIQTKKT